MHQIHTIMQIDPMKKQAYNSKTLTKLKVELYTMYAISQIFFSSLFNGTLKLKLSGKQHFC